MNDKLTDHEMQQPPMNTPPEIWKHRRYRQEYPQQPLADKPLSELEFPEPDIYPETVGEDDVELFQYIYPSAIDIAPADQDVVITTNMPRFSDELQDALSYLAEGEYTIDEAYQEAYQPHSARHPVKRFESLVDDDGYLSKRYQRGLAELADDK